MFRTNAYTDENGFEGAVVLTDAERYAAAARAHRDREATNERYQSVGLDPLTSPPDLAYTPESSALRRRSIDLTRALAETRKP